MSTNPDPPAEIPPQDLPENMVTEVVPFATAPLPLAYGPAPYWAPDSTPSP